MDGAAPFPRGKRATATSSGSTITTVSKSGTKIRSANTTSSSSSSSRMGGVLEDALFGVAATNRKREVAAAAAASSSSAAALAAGKRSKKGSGYSGSLAEALETAGAGDAAIDAELLAAAGGLVRKVNAGGFAGAKGKVDRIFAPQFKSLEPGTLLLGMVKRVTRRQLFVALPYGLSGLVSVREVADVLLFQDSPESDDSDDEDDDDEEDDDNEDSSSSENEDEDEDEQQSKGSGKKQRGGGSGGGGGSSSKRNASSLEAFFAVGQTVRCAVVSTSSTKHGRKSVNLTLRPSVINRGLFLEHLGGGAGFESKKAKKGGEGGATAAAAAAAAAGSGVLTSVYGAVTSVEDHGYIISFGGPEMGFTGFLRRQDVDHHPTDVAAVAASAKAAAAGEGGRSSSSSKVALRVGQPLELAVAAVNAAARTVSVVATRDAVVAARMLPSSSSSSSQAPLPVRAIKPGALVSATVVRLVQNGLVVKFECGGKGGGKKSSWQVGVVEQSHLPVHCKQEHWRGVYAAGDALPAARVLSCDYAARAFTLTLRPHLLSLAPPSAIAPPGLVVDTAEVSEESARKRGTE
jgi:hypothetical protein